MAIDCFKGIKGALREKYQSRIKEGMTDEQLRDIGTEVVLERFNELAKEMTALNKSVGVKKYKVPVVAIPKKKPEAPKPQSQQSKPEKPKTTPPEIIEVQKHIEKAQADVIKAKEAFAKKAKELDKKIVEDQRDLFGERKSKDEGKLFDERVDIKQRNKALEKERADLQKAEDNLKKLRAKKAELEISGETTQEINFDAKDVKLPPFTPAERKAAVDAWFKKYKSKETDDETSRKEARELLKKYFTFEIDGQKYVTYPNLYLRNGDVIASYRMSDAYQSFFERINPNDKFKVGQKLLTPINADVVEVTKVHVSGRPVEGKTIFWMGRPHKSKPFKMHDTMGHFKYSNKMEYLPAQFAPGAVRPDPYAKNISFLDTLEEKLSQLDQQLAEFGRETLGVNLPVAIARTAVIAMRGAIRTARTVGEVIDAGWQAIQQTNWFQNLTGKEQHDLQQNGLVDLLNNTFAAHNAITPEEAAKMTDDTYKETNEALNAKPKGFKEKKKRATRNLITKITDRQFVSKKLVDMAGMQTVKDLMINAHGSSGKAARIFGEAYDKIFFGLNKEGREMLDKIIFLRRIIAIDTNRESKNMTQIMHPKGLDADTANKALETYKERLGEKKFDKIMERADNYFKAYEELLDAKYENGLINKAVYESLKGLDYQPRLFLQHILDFEGNVNLGKADQQKSDTGGLSKEIIQSLDEGSMNNLIMNSEWLLSTSLAAATKSMSINNINKKFIQVEYPKALAKAEKLREAKKDGKEWSNEDARFMEYFTELDSKFVNNPIVDMKPAEPGETDVADALDVERLGTEKQPVLKPVYQYSKPPKPNMKKAYFYDKGVRNEFFLENELHESWFDTANGLWTENTREIVSYASGSALLKGIATGNNPSFAIVNAPRDYLFTAVFSPQYSVFLPKSMAQAALDAAKGTLQIFKYRKGQRGDNLLNKYIEYGGNMEWLSTQGRLKRDTMLGQAINSLFPKTKDYVGVGFNFLAARGFSTYSEIVFRLALFQRTVKNELKDRGYKTIDDVREDASLTPEQRIELEKDIFNRGVAEGRSILDFNQGGTLSKDAESLLPYINTAIQGTRVAYDAYSKNPEMVLFKVAQASAIGSTAFVGLSLLSILKNRDEEDKDKNPLDIWLDTMDGLSQHQKTMYFNWPTARKNKDGQYQSTKIAKNHQLTPILSFTDDLTYNAVAALRGRKQKSAREISENVFDAFNSNISPISLYNSGSGRFTNNALVDGIASGAAQNVTRNPVMKSMLTYVTGYDFYRDQPLALNVGDDLKPLEGQNMKNVESFYKDLGRDFYLSPVRVKAAVEAFITQPSTNPYIGGWYGVFEAVNAEDQTMSKMASDITKSATKAFTKRFDTYTSDFNRSVNSDNKFRKKEYKLRVKEGFDRIDRNDLAKRFTNGDITFDDLMSKVQELPPQDQVKVVDKVEDYLRLQMVVDRQIFDIKYAESAKLKALMILNRYGNIFDGSQESNEVLRQMEIAQGILSEAVMIEYNALISDLDK